MTWESVETARCNRCRIFTPRSDLVFGPDGNSYCCGIPGEAYRVAEDARRIAALRQTPLERTTRLVVAAMLVLTFAFPLAACCSQL